MTLEEIEVLQDVVDMYRQEFGAGDSRYDQAMAILARERAAQPPRTSATSQAVSSPNIFSRLRKLYEITNGYFGMSYVRVYAWAASQELALEMARKAFDAQDMKDLPGLEIKELFGSDKPAFCTVPSDSGFDWE